MEDMSCARVGNVCQSIGKDGLPTPDLSRDRLYRVVRGSSHLADHFLARFLGCSRHINPVFDSTFAFVFNDVSVVAGAILFADSPSWGELGGHGGGGELVAVDGPAAAWGGGWGRLEACSWCCAWCWCCAWGGVVLGGGEVDDGDCEGYEEGAHGDDDPGFGFVCGWRWRGGRLLWVGLAGGLGLWVGGAWLGWLAWEGLVWGVGGAVWLGL